MDCEKVSKHDEDIGNLQVLGHLITLYLLSKKSNVIIGNAI